MSWPRETLWEPWRRWSIRSVLTLSMVLLVVAAVSTTTALDGMRQKRELLDDLQAKGRLVAEALGGVLGDALYFADVERARHLSSLVRAMPEVERYRVVSLENRILVDSAASKYAAGSLDEQTFAAVVRGVPTTLQHGDSIDVIHPILAGGVALGGVVLTLDTTAIGPAAREILFEHLWQGLLATLLGVVAAYWLASWLTAPVRSLIRAAQRIDLGELKFSVDRSRSDEIGELSQAFQGMVRRLERQAQEQADKYAALKLRASEARYQGLFENVVVAAFRSTPDGRIRAWNQQLLRLFGYSSEEELRRLDLARDVYADPDQQARIVDELMNCGFVRSAEIACKRKDGSLITVLANSRAVRDDDGELLYFETTLMDITERKQAEEELAEARQELEHLLAASPAVTYRSRRSGDDRGLYVSPNVTGVLGWEPRDFGESPDFWAEHVHPDDAAAVAEAMRRLADEDHITLEYRFQHKDGTYRWMHDRVRVTRDADGNPAELVGNWIDVTERRQLESSLRQSQKMQAVGQLAGGIAHDFNNLLTVVSGNADLALMKLDPEDPVCTDIASIRKAGDRAADLTRQLLAFSRQQMLQPRILDLNVVVGEFEELLRRAIGEHIQLCTDLDPALSRVEADPVQIEQVLLNLAVNARDAMPGGGKLTLATRNVSVGEVPVRGDEDVPPGPYVLLEVADEGTGMDRETRQRAFEPFFTTKDPAEASGLGLATVYGIVKQSGGHIEVETEPGEGTTFRILLPQQAAEASATVSEETVAEVPGGSETILVAEDEEEVRAFAVRVLEGKGYQVLAASDPEEARRVCSDHADPIELLLTDVVMPRGTGVDLAQWLSGVHPETKVLYMSGYTDKGIVRDGQIAPELEFLAKPLEASVLALKVRELLDRST